MVETGLPEPYDRAAALLSDLDEQIEMFEQSTPLPPNVVAILSDLRKRVAAAGLLVMLASGASAQEAPKSCLLAAAEKVPPIPGLAITSFKSDVVTPFTASSPGYAKIQVKTKTGDLEATFLFNCSWGDGGTDAVAAGVQ